MTDLDTTDASDLREQFERDGFVVLPDFVDPSACDALKARANELVAGFEPDATVRSIFSTNEQTRTTDDYFLGSGDDIRFFFEEEAFGPDGELNQPLELSINKFGHAQHDLDPVFDSFSRSPELADVADRLGFGGHVLVQSMYIFKQPHIGGEVTCHNDHTFIWPTRSRASVCGSRSRTPPSTTAACGRFRAATGSRSSSGSAAKARGQGSRSSTTPRTRPRVS